MSLEGYDEDTKSDDEDTKSDDEDHRDSSGDTPYDLPSVPSSGDLNLHCCF